MSGVYKAMAERYRNMARKYELWGVEFAAWDSTIEDHIRQPLQQPLQEAIPTPSDCVGIAEALTDEKSARFWDKRGYSRKT